MTWGDDIAAKMLGSTMPAGFVQCAAMWEQPTAACPLISLETLKTILGIQDTSQDAELTRLIGVYSQAIENYVERQLCQGAREVVYVPRQTCTLDVLTLPQLPVASLEHIDVDGTVWDAQEIADTVVDGRTGLVYPKFGHWTFYEYIHIKYTGGYDPIPPDLEDAIASMINRYLSTGGTSAETGPLKSQRVEGAVTETYYDARSSAASASEASSSGAGLVGSYAGTLDYYRGERAFI